MMILHSWIVMGGMGFEIVVSSRVNNLESVGIVRLF